MTSFQRRALLICRQKPEFRRAVSTTPVSSTLRCPETYEDIRGEERCFEVEIDTPSDREPSYQFFGRKRLLLRVSMSTSNPVLLPGDTIEMCDEVKNPKRFLLANYDPVPFNPGSDSDAYGVAQFIIYEMDQDVVWKQRVTTAVDPVTKLPVESAANIVQKVIPVTLETLYEERDRSLVTKQERRRVITGAPLNGGDLIVLHCSNDRERDEIEMKIIRVEYLSGIYVCEAQ